ncbi:hypothetical protein TNCV_2855651 [Trichonephila clavipes]|nr:hypothetical protein TNCV_2855651 [Trichonephila clavipes]
METFHHDLAACHNSKLVHDFMRKIKIKKSARFAWKFLRLNSYSKLMSYSQESFCYNELLITEQMIKRALLVCFHDVEIKNMCASLLESKRRRLEEVSYAKGRHTS